VTCELRNCDAPKSQLDAEVVGKEHAHRVAIEESMAKRKRNIAIVMERGRKYEGPPDAAFGNPKELRTPP
jgi:hypothetical protein